MEQVTKNTERILNASNVTVHKVKGFPILIVLESEMKFLTAQVLAYAYTGVLSGISTAIDKDIQRGINGDYEVHLATVSNFDKNLLKVGDKLVDVQNPEWGVHVVTDVTPFDGSQIVTVRTNSGEKVLTDESHMHKMY